MIAAYSPVPTPMEWTPPPDGIAMCQYGISDHLREEASNGGC